MRGRRSLVRSALTFVRLAFVVPNPSIVRNATPLVRSATPFVQSARTSVLATSFILLACLASAQPPARRATTVEAIRAYPGFYHGQAIAIVGQVARRNTDLSIGTDAGSLRLVGRDLPNEGAAEVRGVMYDIGRMNQDDPRLITLDLRESIVRAYGERWPRPGEELIVAVTRSEAPSPATSATTPSIRSVALAPQRYVDQRVTLVGQFRGRNLFGDVPEAPTSERTDFVVRAADGAVWVTGVRPRGKGFAFETTRRVDTGRWIRVVGTMKYARGLVWMEATSITLAEALTDEVAEVVVPPPPAPLDVLFSSPSEGELDVRLDAVLRLQFSRDVLPASLKERIRIAYADGAAGDAPAQAVNLTFTYTPATRGLEIRPTEPLQPLRPLVLELLDGIQGPDGARLAPFKVTFTTGSP